MACPIDGTTLVMSDRQGRRDRLLPQLPRRLARSRRTRQDHRAQQYPERDPRGRSPRHGYAPQPGFGGGYQSGYHHPHHKRRKSFLEEIFD
jgi:hypothetical protein